MKITHIAKYIDQPLIINKISQAAPLVLATCAAGLGVHDVFIKKHNDNQSQKDRIIKNAVILGAVAGASLLTARGLKIGNKKIFSGLIETPKKSELIKEQTQALNDYLDKVKPNDEKLVSILNKAKDKALGLKDADYVLSKLNKEENAKGLIEKLFGAKKDLSSAEIFSEIGKLSLLGLIPVVSGVIAGIAVENGPKKVHNNTDRIKEGFYQYFANIFLCNVGAGAALFGLESLKKANMIKTITPSQKFMGMIAGIMATGVIGGSFIANYMSKKIIDPVLLNKKEENLTLGKIYDERTPEGIDMAMHIDDLATAGVLSGLKWIEPILPAFYLFSGYRAGMGYRNQEHSHFPSKQKHIEGFK